MLNNDPITLTDHEAAHLRLIHAHLMEKQTELRAAVQMLLATHGIPGGTQIDMAPDFSAFRVKPEAEVANHAVAG